MYGNYKWRGVMKFSICITVFAIAIDLTFGRRLLFSNVIWRHGDRSYLRTYPKDPYKDSHIWKKGLGELTNIGIKQQYNLGKYLRAKYSGLLSKEYLRAQIYIRSTDVDRTIVSALANLAGLYSVTKDEMWNGSSTNWLPIPVHAVPGQYDDLLLFPLANCPKYDEILKRITLSPGFVQHEKEYSKFYKFIEENTGLPSIGLLNFSLYLINDNLFCLKTHNFTLPEWATDQVMAKLQQLVALELGIIYTGIDNKHRKEISQMQGGVLVKNIIQNMEDRIAGRNHLSVIAYSAHDKTLVPLLVSLGSYDWIQPDYASCIMADLYRNAGQYEVNIKYRRGNGSITTLRVYGCDAFCKFEEFVEILHGYIPDDRDKVCNKELEGHHD